MPDYDIDSSCDMYSIRRFSSELSLVIAAFIALYSAQPYFAWGTSAIKVLLLAVFLSLRFFFLTRKTLTRNKLPIYVCCVLWLYLYVFHAPNLNDALSSIFTKLLPLLFVILLTIEEKRKFLRYVTNLFAIIIAVSLFFFTIWFCGISLPSTIIEHTSDSFYPHFTSYYFFIIQGNLGILTRFQSIFTEPGHLGMLSALLLYANSYNFRKWQCWVLLSGVIWSFSLAAYILLISGVIIYRILSTKRIIISIMKTVIVMACFIVGSVAFYIAFPDTILSTLIFSRLEINEERGISGNNRNDASFMKYYKELEETKNYFTGIGIDQYAKLTFSGGNSSYRVFIVQYGLIGITLLFLFGVGIVWPVHSKIYWGLLLLYCLSFYQRPYALWEIESFSFLCFSGKILLNKK